MKTKDIIKSILSYTTTFFTFITAIYAAIQMIVNVGAEGTYMEASWLLLIFLFSFLAAISQCIYKINSIGKGIRVTVQYLIIMFASYVCFFAPLHMRGSQVMVGLMLVTIVYFICFGIGSFFMWSFKKNTKKEEVYELKYQNKNKKKK